MADFVNGTGEAMFDEVLRVVAKDELKRSPAVVVDYERLQELLTAMGRWPVPLITPDLARQACQRDGDKFTVEGAINPQGGGYVIELAARDCATGRSLFQEHDVAKNRDDVMPTVSGVAAAARLRFSGAVGNVGADPAPLATSSLQAYKAFSCVGVGEKEFFSSA